MSWQTHTVFNQPAPLNNSNLFLSDGALCEAVSGKARDGIAIFSPALANNWERQNHWNWGVWRTRILLSCCVTIPGDSVWMTFAFIPPGTC